MVATLQRLQQTVTIFQRHLAPQESYKQVIAFKKLVTQRYDDNGVAYKFLGMVKQAGIKMQQYDIQ